MSLEERQVTLQPFDGKDILAHVHHNDIPANWHVYHSSHKKLIALIALLWIFVIPFLGLLAFVLINHSSDNQMIPVVIMVVTVIIATLFSMYVWIPMKDFVLVVTPEGFVFGNSNKQKVKLALHYQNVEYITVMVVGINEQGFQSTRRIECTLFDSPTRKIVSSLIKGLEDFRQSFGLNK